MSLGRLPLPRLAGLAPHLAGDDLAGAIDRMAARFAGREPDIESFLPEDGRFARLRREAAELARRYPEPAARPPFYGLPFGVKDVFHADGFPTGAGSRLPPAELTGPQAEVVSRLKSLGALVAGKTVSTEFAYFSPGPTRNPHALEHTPGGSSSGSAAAVAAGLCPLALGTQTIGSVSRPAAYCGVVGTKPSYGSVPAAGLIPLAPSLDHVGWFTPDVGLAAAVTAALRRPFEPVPETGDEQPRLAVPAGPYLERAGEAARQHFAGVRSRLEAAGYEIFELPAFADFDQIEARHRRIVAAEALAVHADWYARYAELYQPKTRELLEAGRTVPEEQLARDLAGRDRLRDELTAAMDEHGADLWISPPAPGPAPRGLGSTGDPVMNLPWTHAGLPTLTLPAGRDPQGLPMGLQLAARWDRDEALLAWGAGIERALAGGDG